MINLSKRSVLRIFSALLFVTVLWSCGKKDDEPIIDKPDTEDPGDTADWVIEPIIEANAISHIEWGTPKKVSHEVFNAAYPRMIRLGGDTLLLVYHGGSQNNDWDNIYLRKSYDLGETWTEPETLMVDDDPDYWGFANPELLELRSGRILMAFTGRGRPDDNQHDNIQVMHSDDRGVTWSDPRIVAYGRSWEPAMVQHPNGNILMFYSSEARWWGTGQDIEQEILLVKSKNEGISWSLPKSVAYTTGVRDGMPVPVVLREGKGIAFAIESVGNADSPYILHSSLENSFEDRDKVTRRLAAPKTLVGFGGGPYLIQLPTGETILSLHDTGGRDIGSDWMKNTMYVLIGDSEAKNFSSVSYPFPDLPADKGAFFNSVCALDQNTVVALASRNFEGYSEVHWVTGSIIREE